MRRLNILIAALCLLNINLIAQSNTGPCGGSATFCGVSGGGFVVLTLDSIVGTVTKWESSTDGGLIWTSTGNTFYQQGYAGLTTTTCYRAIVQQLPFPPDTSNTVCINVFIPTVPGALSAGTAYCSSTNSGSITLSGNTGNVLNWQSSIDGGATWTSISNATTTLNYSGITQTTIYEAVVQNDAVCLIDTSTQSTISILPPSVAGTISQSGNDTVCYFLNSSTITSVGNTGTVIGWLSSTNAGSSWTSVANTTNTLNAAGLIQATTYAALIQNGTCPADTTNILTLNVFSAPAPVSAGNDTTLQPGQSVTLNGSGTGSPFWTPAVGLSNQLIFNPVATPPNTVSYILYVTDAKSCLNADTVTVTILQPKFTGAVSNYFSPNGDGINDTWYIEDITVFPKNEVTVYNIYGSQVFSQTQYNNDWKGTYNGADLPDGTYYYVLKFTDTSKIIKGTIDILRKK